MIPLYPGSCNLIKTPLSFAVEYDKGVDLILTYTDGFGIPDLDSHRTCLVQIKAYTGEISNILAIGDLEHAFSAYPDADCGHLFEKFIQLFFL